MTLAETVAPPATHGLAQSIADFVARASFDAVHLAPQDVDALRPWITKKAAVYIPARPQHPDTVQIDTAVAIGAAGLEPVPHLAVRRFVNGAELDRHLATLVDRARVRRVLVVAGEEARPAGPFHRAVDVIESGLLQARGISEIGIAGYPGGHPWLPAAELERALVAKIEAAVQTGLKLHIVTQFGFALAPILSWLDRVRDLGIEHPLRIGFAGPAPLAVLMQRARVCGVTVSPQDLALHSGLGGHAFGMVAPDRLVRRLVEVSAALGEVTPHFYAFSHVATVARWTASVAAGRIALDRTGGFAVEPV